MKFKFFILLFLSSISYSFSQTYVSENGFGIYFPGETTRTSKYINTDMGQVLMVTFMYEEPNAAYMVAYSDYGEDYTTDDTFATLESIKEAFCNSLEMEAIFSRKVACSGYEGIYFQAQGDGLYLAMKDFLVGTVLYQVGILRADRFPTNDEIDGFINTLEFD